MMEDSDMDLPVDLGLLAALPRLAPGDAGRIILMAAAEFRRRARAVSDDCSRVARTRSTSPPASRQPCGSPP